MRMTPVGTMMLFAVCAVTVLVLVMRRGDRESDLAATTQAPKTAATAGAPQPASSPVALPETDERPARREVKPANEVPQPKPVEAVSPTNLAAKIRVRPNPPATQADPPPTDQLARTALGFVGMDPEAEEYWLSAINDPALPREERKNLIEDLNEGGLSDPRHPTSADLPLILSRLELIEQLAPDAMDEANADAFQEAFKDLLNLAELAQGRGRPVQ